MTKLYLVNNKANDILPSVQIITWIWNNTPKNFSTKLKSYVSYLKEEPEILTKIYNRLLEKNININNFNDNLIDKIINKIYNLIDKTYREEDNKMLEKIYKILLETSTETKKINDVDISNPLFIVLTEFSKKKILWYKLKNKFPQKEWENFKDYKCRLKKEINKLTTIYRLDTDTIYDAVNIWLDDIFYQIALTFSKSDFDSVKNLVMNYEWDDKNFKILLEFLAKSGVDEKVLNELRLQMHLSKELKPTLTSQNEEKITGFRNSSLSDITTTERKTIADFNPFLLSFSFDIGIKTLWYDRFIEIYQTTFSNIANDILKKVKWKKPSFSKFLKFETNKLKGKKEAEKREFTYQYLIEFNVKDFDIKKLKQLAILVNEEIWDINLSSPKIWEKFRHPLSTINETSLEFNGYFSDSGEEFADNNIILIKWKNTQKIRLTLNNFSQDEFIYLINQIGYYIKHWKFIDKHQLYFDIYSKYNTTLFNSKIYNISVMKENYENFFKSIVFPFTKEGIWKVSPDNTLLTWVYGTGKSQFLKHILLNRNWEFNNKNFFLNANIVSMWLTEFKALLTQWIGWIRTRLDQIYQRTNVPIILLIEDIDTLVNEKMHWVNDEIAQAMTILFEWLGSLPVNIIATANNPTKLSERLIRPWRLYNIQIFKRPSEKEKKQILNQHLDENNLDITDKYLNIIFESRIFKKWTASHIWAIVKELKKYEILMKELNSNDYELNDKDIKSILKKMPISVKDINQTEKLIDNWYYEIMWKEWSTSMWFINK